MIPNMVLAILTALASMVFASWWLFTVDWKLGTAFICFLVTIFVVTWSNENEE